LSDVGLSNAVARFLPDLVGRGNTLLAEKVAARLFLTQLGITLLIGFLIVSGRDSIASLFNEPQIARYLPLVGSTLVIAVMVTFLRAMISGTQQFRAKMRVDIAASLMLLTGIALLAVYNRLGVRELLYVDIGVGVFQLIFLCYYLRSHLSIGHGFGRFHEKSLHLIRYCAGVFFFTTLYAFLMQKVETFFITRYHNSEQIAFFNLSFNIAMSLLVLLPAALASVMLPTLAKSYGRNDRADMARTFTHSVRFMAFLILPIGLGGALIAPALIETIYGTAYAPAGEVLRVLLLSAMFSSIVTMIIPVFWALGESIPAAVWLIPNAALSICLAYLFIPRHAAIGAAFSNLIAQLSLGVSGIAYLRYRHGFFFPIGAYARIGVAAILVAILARLNILVFGPTLGLISGFLMAVASYVPALLLLRVVTVDDLNTADQLWDSLPRGASRPLKYATNRIRAYATVVVSES
jgi:O-antigen/teichoic acid export membrane protein